MNEALIDNWEPVSWVVSGNVANVFRPGRMSEKRAQQEVLGVIRMSGLPIMDLNRKPIDISVLEAML